MDETREKKSSCHVEVNEDEKKRGSIYVNETDQPTSNYITVYMNNPGESKIGKGNIMHGEKKTRQNLDN